MSKRTELYIKSGQDAMKRIGVSAWDYERCLGTDESVRGRDGRLWKLPRVPADDPLSAFKDASYALHMGNADG